MRFDRDVYFAAVRESLFYGELTQQQVNGQEAILALWEKVPLSDDLRHLAYPLATTKHETASTMWPIEEYGKGEGSSYGKPAGPYGECYYGRGDVQLTWWENYVKARDELGLTGDDDLEKYPDRALDPTIAGEIMFRGMWEGWFRSGNTLPKYFDADSDDAFNAREIINGDKNYDVSWDTRPIGEIIAGYHDLFLEALEAAAIDAPPQPRPPRPPLPPRPPKEPIVVTVNIFQPPGVRVEVNIDEGKL